MKDLAQRALDTAVKKGASYVEARIEDVRQRYLSTKNGQPAQVRDSQSYGLGVRVIAKGAWGFAATDVLTQSRRPRHGNCGSERALQEGRRALGAGTKIRRPLGSALPH